MNDQASRLRELAALANVNNSVLKTDPARFIAITSGKGGVGKSMVTANLAVALTRLKKKVIVVDADFGTANQHILFDTYGRYNLSHVLEDKVGIEECCVHDGSGVTIISGGSGISKLADLSAKQRNLLIEEFKKLEFMADYILFDTGAGISKNVANVAMAADEVVVVTTPEPTAITDAYAMVKTISAADSTAKVKLVMNMAVSKAEADRISSKIAAVSRQFLNMYIERVGVVVKDDTVSKSIREKRLLMRAYPNCKAALGIQQLAAEIVKSSMIVSQSKSARNNFWKRLTDKLCLAS